MNTIKVLVAKQPLDRNVFGHPVKVVVKAASHSEASNVGQSAVQ
jgi:hypothetical protein